MDVVNGPLSNDCFVTGPIDPDRDFALVHVPTSTRDAVAALWALDAALGRIVASTSQPMIGQMRLTWWHDAMLAGRGGEPVLAALTTHVHPIGIDGAALVPLVEGWEVLLDPLPLGADALYVHARARGDTLFALSAQAMGCPIAAGAGGGWALADFAGRCSDAVTARAAYAQARLRLRSVDRLPRALRILAHLAARDAAAERRTPRTRWQLLRASF